MYVHDFLKSQNSTEECKVKSTSPCHPDPVPQASSSSLCCLHVQFQRDFMQREAYSFTRTFLKQLLASYMMLPPHKISPIHSFKHIIYWSLIY